MCFYTSWKLTMLAFATIGISLRRTSFKVALILARNARYLNNTHHDFQAQSFTSPTHTQSGPRLHMTHANLRRRFLLLHDIASNEYMRQLLAKFSVQFFLESIQGYFSGTCGCKLIRDSSYRSGNISRFSFI